MVLWAGVLGCGGGAEAPLGPEERLRRVLELADGVTDDEEEAAIVALFEGVRGPELLELKRAVDRQGDENLLHLVTSDVDDPELRARLLAHFRAAAGPDRVVRVLSDIDDTVICSLHDDRYDRGARYPGVIALYEALGDGVTFVSARPGERTGVVEAGTLEQVRRLGFVDATVLPGTVTGLASHEGMAEAKRASFDLYAELFPEADFVFVGDSGQGDAVFGRGILASGRVKAVFVHDLGNPHPVEPGGGLFYVDDYADAALLAQELGLLDAAAAAGVVEHTRAELAAMPFADEAKRATLLASLPPRP